MQNTILYMLFITLVVFKSIFNFFLIKRIKVYGKNTENIINRTQSGS